MKTLYAVHVCVAKVVWDSGLNRFPGNRDMSGINGVSGIWWVFATPTATRHVKLLSVTHYARISIKYLYGRKYAAYNKQF